MVVQSSSAPLFGGLWEAGIKSMEYNLKRNMGNISLACEEFTTFIT